MLNTLETARNQSSEYSSPKLDSAALRTFLVVAECQNVSRAAERLFRTQSAISTQIKQLENILSTKLFIREARGMSLTNSGAKLLPSAISIISKIDQTAQSFLQAPIEGFVSMAIPDDYGTDLIATILAEFAQRHPKVEVDIHCKFGQAFKNYTDHQRLDLAVFTSEHREHDDEVLLEEQTVWVCSHKIDHIDLNNLEIVLFDRKCWWRDATLTALESIKAKYRVAYTSGSITGVKAAIKAGLAIGILARSTVDSSMKILDSTDGLPALPSSQLLLRTNPSSSFPDAAEALGEAIRQSFSAHNTI